LSKQLNEILFGIVDPYDPVSSLLSSLNWISVESSNLAAIAYQPDSYELFIAFLDGSVYVYDSVPIEEYQGLLGAESHGEFFYDNIRMVYPFERFSG
jgi:hypothetical protein